MGNLVILRLDAPANKDHLMQTFAELRRGNLDSTRRRLDVGVEAATWKETEGKTEKERLVLFLKLFSVSR